MRRLRWVLVPLLAPLTLWCLLGIASVVPGGPNYWSSSRQSLQYLALSAMFGLPIAYAATGLLGFPAVVFLERRGWDRPATYALAGAVIGLTVGVAFVGFYARDSPDPMSLFFTQGGARSLLLNTEVGLVCGIAFGFLSRSREKTP